MQQIRLDIPKPLQIALATLDKQGFKAIIVGGFVRDTLLGLKSKDIDIEIFGCNKPENLLKHLKTFGAVKHIGKQFGIIQCIDKTYTYEFSLPRHELKTGLKHQDFQIDFIPQASFKQAAYRRDFSINSIGYNPKTKQFLDPYKGIKDLKLKRLVHNSDAFEEDPLRVLRALQFAARFEFKIAYSTRKRCKKINLENLSLERIETEFEKALLMAKKPSYGLKYFFDLGLDSYFFKHQTLNKAIWLKNLLFIDRLKKELDTFDLLNQKVLLLTGIFWISYQSIKPKTSINTKQQISLNPSYLMISLLCKNKKCLNQIQKIIIATSCILEHKTLDKYHCASIIYDSQKQNCLKNTLYFIKALNKYKPSKKLDMFLNYTSNLNIKKTFTNKGNDLMKLGIKPGPQLKKALKQAHITEMLN